MQKKTKQNKKKNRKGKYSSHSVFVNPLYCSVSIFPDASHYSGITK